MLTSPLRPTHNPIFYFFCNVSEPDRWHSYAKRNSYGDNKVQCRDQLAPVGRGGRENDWSDAWKQPQKDKEGRGWADMKATTADNCFTGEGSKHSTAKVVVVAPPAWDIPT